MKCKYCNDTGKYKKPNDQAKFDYLCDHLTETNGFCSQSMAETEAYKKVGYTLIDCPYCNKIPVKE